MNKVLLIIQREYFSRVKKKSFLILTFLVPTLFIGMYALIAFLIIKGDGDRKTVNVLDETGIFKTQLKDNEKINFEFVNGNYGSQKTEIKKKESDFLLYIPADYMKSNNIEIISLKKPGLSTVNDIESDLEDILEKQRLIAAGIDTNVLKNAKVKIQINAKQLTDDGEKDASVGATFIVGFVAAFLIYISLFIYGAQVMRGIIEEKTSRIVEVMISSVKPFQLMLGKIIGIGMVGLTQFLLWIILSTGLTAIASNTLIKKDDIATQISKGQTPDLSAAQTPPQNSMMISAFNAAKTVNYTYILSTFIFYFLGGYLIYSALFAAVGSAVDNETETQQFMLPITLPLIFTFILGMNFIVNNPDSSLSFWLSMIPFTSPIAMMIRIPYGVPGWQLALSMILLVAGFIFTTWVASRIYRVGILMYGKKVSYKELVKWFNYKE